MVGKNEAAIRKLCVGAHLTHTVNSDGCGVHPSGCNEILSWLWGPDLNLQNLSQPHICSRGRRVTHPYCPESMLLSDFLVSLLVALGLPISGDLRRLVASRIFHISMKWHDLAGSGNFGQTAPNGLKGRCSTTELRPYVLLTSYIKMT
jgi:hypothetical protein